MSSLEVSTKKQRLSIAVSGAVLKNRECGLLLVTRRVLQYRNMHVVHPHLSLCVLSFLNRAISHPNVVQAFNCMTEVLHNSNIRFIYYFASQGHLTPQRRASLQLHDRRGGVRGVALLLAPSAACTDTVTSVPVPEKHAGEDVPH